MVTMDDLTRRTLPGKYQSNGVTPLPVTWDNHVTAVHRLVPVEACPVARQFDFDFFYSRQLSPDIAHEFPLTVLQFHYPKSLRPSPLWRPFGNRK